MSTNKIISERKDVNPSVHISSDGKVYVDRFDRDGGKLYNNSGNSIYDSTTYNFDKTGKLSISLPITDGTVSTGNTGTGNTGNVDTGTGGEDEASAWEKYLATYGSTGSSDVGGMSYGDYLKTYGTDTEKAYSQMVRQANSDYYRALMTYGKNAEALGGAGLVGAGVSDYGNAAAYAARQGAVATAGAAKMETDAKQAASYAEYLQNLRAQQEAQAKQDAADRTNYMLTLMSTGVDRDTAIGMLNQSGMFTDEAQYNAALGVLNSHYDNVDKKTAEATQTVTDATQTEANTRYNELTASGMAPDAAEIQVNQEYGESFGTNARNNAKEITQTHDNAAVDTMLTGNYSPFNENAYTVDYFKKQVAAGVITEEEAEVQIEKIENANLDWVYKMLSDANNANRIDDVKSILKISGEFESYENEVTATVDAVFEALRSLVISGELSEDKAMEIYQDYFNETAALKEKNKEGITGYLQAISNLLDKFGYMDNADEVYGYMVDKVANSANVHFDPIEGGRTVSIYTNSGAHFEMRMVGVSQKDVNGVPKIGAFKDTNGRTVVVYQNGIFQRDGRLYKVSPRGTVGGYGYKKPDEGMAKASIDIFERWLRLKIGA